MSKLQVLMDPRVWTVRVFPGDPNHVLENRAAAVAERRARFREDLVLWVHQNDLGNDVLAAVLMN